MGNYPSECKAYAPNLSCYQCHKRLLNMESFDYVEEQDTYRGKCYVYFTGLYYRLVGEDGIYYCEDCFFEPRRRQQKEAEEARKQRREQNNR